MDVPPSRTGTVPFAVPGFDEPCMTFYKAIGDLTPDVVPVIMLHGGPGAGHGVLLPFAQLWARHGIPVVFYDQIGCGNSTHLRHMAGDESFWQESLFVVELENLLDHLGLRNGPGFYLFGFSWGGMLGAAFAATCPKGLRRLILASPIASKELGQRSIDRWRTRLPLGAQQAIENALQKHDFNSSSFRDALALFQKMALCRSESAPPELIQLFPLQKQAKALSGSKPCIRRLLLLRSQYIELTLPTWLTSVSHRMGPSIFHNPGSLRGWTVVPRLPSIQVPTLIYNGEFDTSDDECCQPFFDLIPRVRWVNIRGAAHMSHLEGPEVQGRVLRIVGDFLVTTV